MGDIDFLILEDTSINAELPRPQQVTQKEPRFLLGLLTKLGITSRKKAHTILMCISIFFLLLAGMISYVFFFPHTPRPKSPNDFTEADLQKLPPDLQEFIRSKQN
jgi:hypothetical protein